MQDKTLKILWATFLFLTTVFTLAGILLISKTLNKHQMLDANRLLSLLSSRITTYEELKHTTKLPDYMESYAWLADELQGVEGLNGVIIKDDRGNILLNTFTTYPPPPNTFISSRTISPVPGKHLTITVGIDTTFKKELLQKASIALGIMWLILSITSALALQILSRQKEQITALERLAVLGKITAMIAHEIRNPLNAIYMAAQMLEENHLKKAILSETQRLIELSQDFLTLPRGLEELELQETNIAELIKGAINRNLTLANVKKIQITLETEDPLKAECNPKWLKRAIDNLIKNALEHSPENSTVKITAQKEGKNIEITVCNPGKKIPKGVRKKLFLPFYTTRKDGFGIGLFIVKEVAKAHRGKVSLKQTDGQICFTISIPGEKP